ncbi:MAG TPA: hypothetical protein VKP88_08105, partial [Candidatus Paceibacterota bacterium]|nr:hypothetical protein [Candidatus Paceibacterota bacterium]
MLRKDSVGNQAWYTSDTGNREQAGTITAASTSGPQFVSKYDESNYSSFQTNASGDLTITPTGENTSVVGDISVSGTLTTNPGVQAYEIGNRGKALYFQSQTNDFVSFLDLFSKRGDGGDDVGLNLWGYGNIDSIDDRHRMVHRYDAASDDYRSYIEHGGTQTAKEYRLYTNDHTEQLVLDTAGSVSMGGSLDVTERVEGKSLRATGRASSSGLTGDGIEFRILGESEAEILALERTYVDRISLNVDCSDFTIDHAGTKMAEFTQSKNYLYKNTDVIGAL